MEEIYKKLVLAGRRTCNEKNTRVPLIPKGLRERVRLLLEAEGYDADGNLLDLEGNL